MTDNRPLLLDIVHLRDMLIERDIIIDKLEKFTHEVSTKYNLPFVGGEMLLKKLKELYVDTKLLEGTEGELK